MIISASGIGGIGFVSGWLLMDRMLCARRWIPATLLCAAYGAALSVEIYAMAGAPAIPALLIALAAGIVAKLLWQFSLLAVRGEHG
jgi:hypothetical protein